MSNPSFRPAPLAIFTGRLLSIFAVVAVSSVSRSNSITALASYAYLGLGSQIRTTHLVPLGLRLRDWWILWPRPSFASLP